MMTVRELLNKHKWHLGDLDQLQIVVRHRGAPGDQRVIAGGDVLDVGPRGLTVARDLAEDGEGDEPQVFLPYHRILVIRGPTGTVWGQAAEPVALTGPVRFGCAGCGQAFTGVLQPVDAGALQVRDGEDLVPAGRVTRWGDPEAVVLNRQDVPGLHPCGARIGCCGPDGLGGPNLACGCGRPVATEAADCWMPHRVTLVDGAVVVWAG